LRLHHELQWPDVTDRVRAELLIYRCLHGTAQLHTYRQLCWSSISAVCQSAEVDRSVLSSEQFLSFCRRCFTDAGPST